MIWQIRGEFFCRFNEPQVRPRWRWKSNPGTVAAAVAGRPRHRTIKQEGGERILWASRDGPNLWKYALSHWSMLDYTGSCKHWNASFSLHMPLNITTQSLLLGALCIYSQSTSENLYKTRNWRITIGKFYCFWSTKQLWPSRHKIHHCWISSWRAMRWLALISQKTSIIQNQYVQHDAFF